MKLLLIICFMVIGMVPAALLGTTLLSSGRQSQVESRMVNAQNQCLILTNKMSSSGYMELLTDNKGLDSSNLDSTMNTIADVFNGRIVVVDKSFKVLKDTFDLSKGKSNVSEEVIKCFLGENSSKYNNEKNYFAITLPVHNKADNKIIDGVLIMTASTENINLLAEKQTEKANFFLLVCLWLLFVISLLLSGILLRPFRHLNKVLNKVAEGNLDEDISSDIYRETKLISSSVSRTLTKLKEVDQSRQEFVSNVSHELKTPITSIRVLADSLMGMENAQAEIYQEFLRDISDEIDRESKIIDDLLTLVKMDKSSPDMNISQVNINSLAEQILKRLRPIAKKRNIELIFESIREVTADVDEVKFSLAINNLVENAIKYNREDGWVKVVLDADHKFFYVKVIDNGIGIPEEFQNKIFERFYRVDKARSRETGGTGLGLAITKSIIMMHQGALKLQSKEGEGTTFTVRIPLTYIP